MADSGIRGNSTTYSFKKVSDGRREFLVVREPTLTKCNCNEVEHHQNQLDAIRELLRMYNAREDIYFRLKIAYKVAVQSTAKILALFGERIFLLRQRDLKRFDNGLELLQLHGRLCAHDKAIDEFDLLRAKMAIMDYAKDMTTDYWVLLRRAETLANNLALAPRRVEDRVYNPFVPRHTDQLGLLDVPEEGFVHESIRNAMLEKAETINRRLCRIEAQMAASARKRRSELFKTQQVECKELIRRIETHQKS
ncbi:MAG: hypothetical protein Q9179_002153 [Wetmoreana sp. 5 TL-2023]